MCLELIKLLPDYYEQNVTMRTLQRILSDVTDSMDEKMIEITGQCYVVTASSYLFRWETMLGLDIDISKSDAFRRERIAAKISGSGTTTKAMIIDVASRYTNGEVEVIENNAESYFTIKFVGTLGIPGNMSDLKKTIEEIKPAHLAVLYEYVYNTWANAGALTWGEAADYTWEQIRTVSISADNN